MGRIMFYTDIVLRQIAKKERLRMVLSLILEMKRELSIPVYAIGGITLDERSMNCNK